MFRELGLPLLMLAIVAGTSAMPLESPAAEPVCACPFNWLPVCGTDGVTYGNQCDLDCARVTNAELKTLRYGACEEPEKEQVKRGDVPENCVCTRNRKPVCGTDGKTYNNQCLLNCAKNSIKDLELKHPGDCNRVNVVEKPAENQDPCICPLNWAPVCGNDGVTYPNQCTLSCGRKTNGELEKKKDGACKEAEIEQVKVAELPQNCVCTRNYKPVCGTDGHTYNNQCLLNCAKKSIKDLELRHPGFCSRVNVVEKPAGNQDSCTCTRNLKPVCGTNGVTYNNPCLLNCARETDQELHVLHEGFCEDTHVNNNDKVKVVEVADNKENDCQDKVKVVDVAENNDKVKVVDVAENNDKVKVVDVADNNDKVKVVDVADNYDKVKVVNIADNNDKVKVVDAADNQDAGSQVKVVENAPGSCVCPRNSKPVCGTDGVSYHSPCLLNCARVKNTDLHIAYEGYC